MTATALSFAAADGLRLSARALGFEAAFGRRVPWLYTAGDVRLLERPVVALVGSRQASLAGRWRAAELADALTRRGVVVMSGLARGIDAAAHRAALELGGPTIAVIGTPLGRAYPREHAALQAELMRDHLVLSPFAPGTRTERWHFPLRNGVMARLAQATVVLEASDQSGSLHQVEESLRVGRPVWLPREVVENTATNWPARFVGRPLVRVFDSPAEVMAKELKKALS